AKIAGVWPLTRWYGLGLRDSNYTTLLMSTGLTFGTISALFGLNNGKITEGQYSILVAVVIASAVVPTLIAQRFFEPRIDPKVGLEGLPRTPRVIPSPNHDGAESSDRAPVHKTPDNRLIRRDGRVPEGGGGD